jgi:hypothetical protein
MRPLVRFAAALILLAGCQMQSPAPGAETSALATDSIAVTALDAAPITAATIAASTAPADISAPDAATVQVPGKTTPHPLARPQDLASAPPEVAAEPAPPVSAEQASCEKTKGQWSAMAESTGHVCVHSTRDSGKSCRRKGDCQGECLAQSGTCSPIMPLMGCNAILQADGSEVTLCLQ